MEEEIKLITEESNPEDVAKEMATSIRKMYEDRDKKAIGAKERLVKSLGITADKYRTANGVMIALDTVREVIGDNANMTLVDSIATAKSMATKMATIAQDMAEKAEGMEPDSFDMICEGFYDTDFASGDGSIADMIEQMLTLQLCQQVGPAAQDIKDFCVSADEEIEKARENLVKYCETNDLDVEEYYG